MVRLWTSILIFCLAITLLEAKIVKKEVSIFFPNDVVKIEPDYSENHRNLARLDSILKSIDENPEATLIKIELAGWASPPATVEHNQRLSTQRANVIKDWITANYNVDIGLVESTYPGVNYPLLSKLVKERGYEYADEVIAIADDAPAPGDKDRRRQRLMKLRGGQVWRDLTIDIFPELRRTDAIIHYLKPDSAKVYIENIDTVAIDIPVVPEAAEPERPEEPSQPVTAPNRYWSVHTNMLYDALAIPNAGVEAYLGKNISLAANWWYAWWKTDRRHRYWRTYGGYIAPRYWFGKSARRKPLTGHHIGLYGQIMLYDFEWGGTGYLSGTPGKNILHQPTWGGGIEYGFALPVGRRLNLDFTLGVGYLQGRYWKYEPMDEHYVWISKHMRHWFGPTKLEVSLVWLLGHGNYNAKKGGEL